MANKKTSKKNVSKNQWYNFGGLLSFWAIIISGTITVINLILQQFGGSFSGGAILEKIVSLMLLLGLIIPGYVFLSKAKLPGKKFIWKTVYFVFVLLLFIGVIALKIK